MSLLLYNPGIFIYSLMMRMISLWNPKVKAGIAGRRHWRSNMRKKLQAGEQRVWIHAASLGEFEQGRPVIERIRKDYPGYKIVLSFFSPSGFEKGKDYKEADYVFYLPVDGARRARDFVDILDPKLAIFIKYEFWYYYLRQLHKKKIPTLFISSSFRKGQPFFKWYGGIFRKMLNWISVLFVQDEDSKSLLGSIGVKNKVMVAGDTRFDRVAAIASSISANAIVEKFKGKQKLLIGGSTWAKDEKLLQDAMNGLGENWKLVIAPHEVNERSLKRIKKRFGENVLLYSETDNNETNDQVLVIDNIGMLSSIYASGDLAWIGGGFRKSGIHNSLEAAVFGIPLFFGPHFGKFNEAVALVESGFARPIHTDDDAFREPAELGNDAARLEKLRESLKQFMLQNTGATDRIMDYVKQDNMLI